MVMKIALVEGESLLMHPPSTLEEMELEEIEVYVKDTDCHLVP